MLIRKRVRLNTDLTRYDSRLTAGCLGWTAGNGQWGVMVNYDCGARLDTLGKSLDVLEDETNQEAARVMFCELAFTIGELRRIKVEPAAIRQKVTEALAAAKKAEKARAKAEKKADADDLKRHNAKGYQ